jgi:asparagine synthase (glutamine-hydrolysing)
MTNRLSHRGPDDAGIWSDATVAVALGHRRLSIIDLSPLGHQPMISASGRYVLVFNGEIYNYRELKAELSGYPYLGTSDTEVMLAAFEKHGVAGSLKRFNGMFALGLWDRIDRVLHLACDRFGEKPLYWGSAGKSLVFGSELKALASHPDFDRAINGNAVSPFLQYGYIPKPLSIYRDAAKIEPGTFTSFRWDDLSADPVTEAFWSARERAADAMQRPFQGTYSDATAELERLLGDSVSMRMVADVPLGAFLSGGIDSTLIVALMQKYGLRRARTFTIGFSEHSYNEAHHARAVAKHLGTEHTELIVTPAEAMSVIPRLGSIYDEPFADSSQVPTFLVSQLARKHVTVALSGDGGDEIFGGYNRYVWAGQVWDAVKRYPRFLRSAAASMVTSISPNRWDRFGVLLPRRFEVRAAGDKVHKLAGILDAGTQEEIYSRLISQWRAPNSVVCGRQESSAIAEEFEWQGSASFLQRMMMSDAVGYLPNDILVKVDRASMAVGLEGRTPYLDHRLFEFAWSLPDEWKVRGRESKRILREVLYKHVPQEMVERPKAGFGIPIGVWLRGPLRGWAESLLDEQRLRGEGFLNPAAVRTKWAQHLSGSHNWYPQLWAVLMFESWLDTWRENSVSVAETPIGSVS